VFVQEGWGIRAEERERKKKVPVKVKKRRGKERGLLGERACKRNGRQIYMERRERRRKGESH